MGRFDVMLILLLLLLMCFALFCYFCRREDFGSGFDVDWVGSPTYCASSQPK
jgi:hypothetical protein